MTFSTSSLLCSIQRFMVSIAIHEGSFDLFKNLKLELGVYVGKKYAGCFPVALREHRLKACEDAKLGSDRSRISEIRAVDTFPPEGGTSADGKTLNVDIPFVEEFLFAAGEIRTHHSDTRNSVKLPAASPK